MSGVVRTVQGGVAPGASGVVDAHEHLVFRGPPLPGQELDDTGLARREPAVFAALGGGTVVRWALYGRGRRAGRRAARARGGARGASSGL